MIELNLARLILDVMVGAIDFSDQSRKGTTSFLVRKDLKMHSWHLLQSSPVPESFVGGFQKLRKH